MRSISLLAFILGLSLAAFGQQRKSTHKPAGRSGGGAIVSSSRSQLSQALEQVQAGRYSDASMALFNLGRSAAHQKDRPQIKYILGLSLYEMGLYQVAAFQFVDVIRSGHPKYSRQAVEKLAEAADILGDDTLLNYTVNRLSVDELPSGMRDMVHFRLGEVRQRAGDHEKAISSFSRVSAQSPFYQQALYHRGLSLLELKKPDVAIEIFRELHRLRENTSPTDTNLVAAKLAIARTLYQAKDFDGAIRAYSEVPRDHVLWHDALFEQSWAMMRAGRFRSALSNFQSLHSSFYEDFWLPESLLLRAIVYLYICKYDEMEKVLQQYERTYGDVAKKISQFQITAKDSLAYYDELARAWNKKNGQKDAKFRIPYIVLREVLEQGDVRRSFNYLRALSDENKKIKSDAKLRESALGRYAAKLLANRIRNTKIAVGDMLKAHMEDMLADLKDFDEQAGLIRYEMIAGKKEVIKSRISGNFVEKPLDEERPRTFYVQNGFEYYPFKGEYWLDEIGNYHYLGRSSCGQ
ncbi:MAG: tetratricopeptide repeat protein [Bdellovibrionaceae bacterium]|nr:tetratricopeptide repeat protein [Pseudobdellovibrionaceae bacterium]